MGGSPPHEDQGRSMNNQKLGGKKWEKAKYGVTPNQVRRLWIAKILQKHCG